MMTTELIAQAIGIVAMVMNCLSYQQKNQRRLLMLQLAGSSLFTFNYFLLGAYAGAMLNLIAMTRALVFLNKEKTKADHIAWTGAFIVSCVVAYVLVFAAFGKPFEIKNLIVEVLPVISMTLSTVSFRYGNAAAVRRFGLICSPLWLIYNIFCFSIGAICTEVLNLVSIILGMLRYDRKKKQV